MVYEVTPFKGSNRKETFLRILTKSTKLVGEATPLMDLIEKLLIKDPTERIKVVEIKGHGFFKRVEWDRVVEISSPSYVPPFSPKFSSCKGNSFFFFFFSNKFRYRFEICLVLFITDSEVLL